MSTFGTEIMYIFAKIFSFALSMLKKNFSIRPLKDEDVELFRSARLEALKDSPDSFGAKYQEEKDQPISYWKDLISKNIDTDVIFAAFDDKKIVGTLFCFYRENQEAGFGGVWVSPHYRHQGIALDLGEKAIVWSKEKGFKKITLWSTETNEAAKKLYMKLDFKPTEIVRRLKSNTNLNVRKWEKIL